MRIKSLLVAAASVGLLLCVLFVAASLKPATSDRGSPAILKQCPPPKSEVSTLTEPPLDPEQHRLLVEHEAARSDKWATFRRYIIEKNPRCRACGGKNDLQVHHLVPYNADPSLELSEQNVIVLCGPGGRNDHLWIGHSGSYRHYNPYAKEDADLKWKRIQERLPNKPREK